MEPKVQSKEPNDETKADETTASSPYPSTLRQVRQNQALMTRAQLMLRCEQLFNTDNTRYVKVGMTTLHDLEAGLRRPRPSTAATLAAALDTSPQELFPSGLDIHVRNPNGHIEGISPSQRTGRPKKSP
jgi:transcriptional regulator with XRE-family HTH domain